MIDQTTPNNSLPTTDKPADTATQVMNGAMTGAEAIVEAASETYVPWLRIIIVKQLWHALLDWIFGVASKCLGTIAGYVFIDIQQYIALKNAAAALADLKAAQAKGNPNEISQASAAMDAAVAPILHYIGRINP